MSTWAKLTINEQIKSGVVERLSIDDIARLIANGNADLEIDLIREMSEDYLATRLRAHGDYVHSLARVMRSGWLDGVKYDAGALVFVTQEQYTANQNFLQIEQSPCFPEHMVSREDFRDYLTLKPALPSECILRDWIDTDEPKTHIAATPPRRPVQEVISAWMDPIDEPEQSRILSFCHHIWISDPDQPTGTSFLIRLKAYENENMDPKKGQSWK